jgi:cytochrome c-type biogenesis protein CcmH/NrfG
MTRAVYVCGTTTLPFVLPRAVLALVAVLVLAWVGVLLRNHEVGEAAVSDRDTGALESARLLDPNRYWDQVLAGVYLIEREPRRAAAEAEELVRAEPDNVVAWSLLREATRGTDPARFDQATAALRRLNPLTAP